MHAVTTMSASGQSSECIRPKESERLKQRKSAATEEANERSESGQINKSERNPSTRGRHVSECKRIKQLKRVITSARASDQILECERIC